MSNIYDAPASNLNDEPAASDEAHKFYVVGPLKFALLYAFTFGFYQLYWFYKNWSRYRAHTQESLWPVPRAIFTIFFTHSLFRRVNETIEAQDLEYSWDPGTLATWYVLAQIANRIMDRLPDSTDKVVVPIELIIMLPVVGYILCCAQRAINVACGDPTGASNKRLTWANYLWLVIGFLTLVLILLGLYADSHGLN
jgi:hypothetical protein